MENEDDPELGRGNRKRKKRKFFDDENDFNGYKHMNGQSKALESSIRKDVFSPEHLSNKTELLPENQNSAFLKPFTQALNPTIVQTWNPKQVASWMISIPRLSCDLAALEAKIIEEELDGEAFLLMTQSDFVTMLGIKLGPAIKIFNALLAILRQNY